MPQHLFNSIRLECFNKSTNNIDVSKLPPTDLAIKQHALRVYLQCQDWKSNKLDPKQWGWEEKDGMLVPTYTTKPLLPDTYVKKFNCGCKTGCKKRCTCKKLGLSCSALCKFCKGTNCENRDVILIENDYCEEHNYDEDELLILEPEIIVNDCPEQEDFEAFSDGYDMSELETFSDEDGEIIESSDAEECSTHNKRQRLG